VLYTPSKLVHLFNPMHLLSMYIEGCTYLVLPLREDQLCHYIKNVDDMVIFNMHMMITMSSCKYSLMLGKCLILLLTIKFGFF
jgi:hypothetical protein